jgi:hypothetical protein
VGAAVNALTLGGILLLYLLLVQSITAFIVTETTPAFELGDCENIVLNNNNTTVCSNPDGPSFVESVIEVSVSGIEGAPEWFNGFWLGIHAFILALGVGLIIAFFVGLFFGGAQ